MTRSEEFCPFATKSLSERPRNFTLLFFVDLLAVEDSADAKFCEFWPELRHPDVPFYSTHLVTSNFLSSVLQLL